MNLVPSARIPDGHLALIALLKEKPHQGLPSKNPAPHLGQSVCNSTTVLGFRAAEHLERVRSRYTGKERDNESGNDYFGSRYLSSGMGRWLSPDIINVSEERLVNPANTLNKYVYGGNNPLHFKDLDGEDIVVAYESSGLTGHIMLFANNPTNGKSSLMSFGPKNNGYINEAREALGNPVESTKQFGLPSNLSDLSKNYASLTIQTTPEEAQKIIDLINNMSTTENPYMLYQRNCTTVARELLKSIGLLPKDDKTWTPWTFWAEVFNKYSRYNNWYATHPENGVDYGNPRFNSIPTNFNTFNWMQYLFTSDGEISTVSTSEEYSVDCRTQPQMCYGANIQK